MALQYEINKVLFLDGILFTIPGLSMFISPSVSRHLKDKVDSKNAAPALRDLKRSAGAANLSMGLFVLIIAFVVKDKNSLNNIAIFRAFSLIFVFAASVLKVLSKRWKKDTVKAMYIFLYGMLILTYLYFGFVEPL